MIDATALAAAEAGGRRYDVDCLAVLLSLDRPPALLGHGSAACLWELPTPRAVEPVVRLTEPVPWRRGRDHLMTCAPLSADERWRTGPLPLTSAARTLADCAREWPLEDAVVAMDAALLAERTTLDDLRRAAAAVPWLSSMRGSRRPPSRSSSTAGSRAPTRGAGVLPAGCCGRRSDPRTNCGRWTSVSPGSRTPTSGPDAQNGVWVSWSRSAALGCGSPPRHRAGERRAPDRLSSPSSPSGRRPCAAA